MKSTLFNLKPIFVAILAISVSTNVSFASSPVMASNKSILIIWDEDEQVFSAIDSETGNKAFTHKLESNCWWELIPMSTFVACTDKASNQYLLDIAHGSRQNIPQKNVDLIGWSSNGKYLVFNKQIGPGNSKHIIRDTLIVYEISLNQAITYSLPQTFQEEFSSSEVRLSSDGKFIAFVAENVGSTQWSLFSLSGGVISKVRDYGSVNLPITQDFVWSSLSSKFVVGTTQATHDGPAFSEKIFLAQAISSTNQLVASSPSGLVFWEGSIEWSPTSDQFVIGLWEASFSSTPQACIFNSQTKKRRCIQAQKGINERFATWAPNGKNVAYVDLQSNLKIASTSFGNTKKLFVSVPETFAIYWRDIP